MYVYVYAYVLILQHQTTDGRANRLQQLTLQRLVSGMTDGRAAHLSYNTVNRLAMDAESGFSVTVKSANN